jgi:hypothetical protein
VVVEVAGVAAASVALAAACNMLSETVLFAALMLWAAILACGTAWEVHDADFVTYFGKVCIIL